MMRNQLQKKKFFFLFLVNVFSVNNLIQLNSKKGKSLKFQQEKSLIFFLWKKKKNKSRGTESTIVVSWQRVFHPSHWSFVVRLCLNAYSLIANKIDIWEKKKNNNFCLTKLIQNYHHQIMLNPLKLKQISLSKFLANCIILTTKKKNVKIKTNLVFPF